VADGADGLARIVSTAAQACAVSGQSAHNVVSSTVRGTTGKSVQVLIEINRVLRMVRLDCACPQGEAVYSNALSLILET
jgi:hypothetical protein